MRKRVDAVDALALTIERLPALAGLLVAAEARFVARLARLRMGKVKAIKRPAFNPEGALQERHPALWRQL